MIEAGDASNAPRFEQGRVLVMREVYRDALWAVRPMTCVRDDDVLLALWMPEGTPWMRPVRTDGSHPRLATEPWILAEARWHTTSVLQIVEEGAAYAVWLMRRGDAFVGWYVNLQEPLRRTALGFDYFDHVLDVVVSPDGSATWKDEDELDDAVAGGMFDRSFARELRRRGEQAIARVRAGAFDEWLTWRADPAWPVPTLAEGWDRV